jgi:hypothetical protein
VLMVAVTRSAVWVADIGADLLLVITELMLVTTESKPWVADRFVGQHVHVTAWSVWWPAGDQTRELAGKNQRIDSCRTLVGLVSNGGLEKPVSGLW